MKKRRNNGLPNTASTASTDETKRPWALIFVIIFIDQLTKLIAPTFFPIVENTGTVFGLFGQNNIVFLLISLVIISLLFFWVGRKYPSTDIRKKKWVQFACYSIIGGGFSNIIDRIGKGYVVDFISLPFWPTFNIADVLITLGVTLLLWQLFFDKQEFIKKEDSAE